MSKVLLGLGFSLAALWAAGEIAGDATWLGGLLFYIPSPLVAIVLVGAAVGARLIRRPRLARAALVGAIFPIAVVLGVEQRWPSPPGDPPAAATLPLRIVHWNVFWGGPERSGLTDELMALDADLYGLSEYPGTDEEMRLPAGLIEGRSAIRFRELVLVARGELTERWRDHRDGHKLWLVDWDVGGERVEVLFVDLRSSLAIHRDPVLRRVTEVIEGEQPDLVIGDFNAPRRSRRLRALPAGHRHAYDVAGTGWGYTWPVPFPIWAIDQCIVGPRLHPRRYELRSTLSSDHRLQRLDAVLEPTRDGTMR